MPQTLLLWLKVLKKKWLNQIDVTYCRSIAIIVLLRPSYSCIITRYNFLREYTDESWFIGHQFRYSRQR